MVRVTLRCSRRLAFVQSAVHISAASTVLPLDIPLIAKAAIALCCTASAAHALLRHAFLRLPGSICAVEMHDQENAAVLLREGEWRDARILETSYVSAAFTVLNLRIAGSTRARHVLLLADNTKAEEYRKARVLLRWRRPAVATAATDADAPVAPES
jgi:toxin CptA